MVYLVINGDFVDKRAERWRDLVDLLNKTIRTDKPAAVTTGEIYDYVGIVWKYGLSKPQEKS